MQAKHVTLRIELPPVNGPAGPPSLVILHLDSLMYSGMGPDVRAENVPCRCMCLLMLPRDCISPFLP